MVNNGKIQHMAANRIALSMHEQVDDDGFKSKLLENIVCHRKTVSAVPISDGFRPRGSECKRNVNEHVM